MLLDTGSTLSILNEETWKKSGQYRPEKLHMINASWGKVGLTGQN